MRQDFMDVTTHVVMLLDQVYLVGILNDIDWLFRIKQEGGNTHRPAAHLAGVAGLSGKDQRIALLQRVSGPGLEDRVPWIADMEGRLPAGSGGPPLPHPGLGPILPYRTPPHPAPPAP